jgi:hypothetical protein
MLNTPKLLFSVSVTLIILAFLQFFGCASIQHPTGGPRDSIPPKIINERPKNFTTRFKEKEINIQFDEYFKLANEFKEVSFSPAMEKSPILKIKKKVLNIEFQEPLQDSTTYTINFGKAIVDYNEGNVLKNYMYVIATGSEIDSLSISGTVVNSLSKKPILDATVFLLPTSQDTLFGKSRASLFTSTDSSGNYSLKYLRANTYNLYAIYEEGGGDKIYNSAKEEIGFINSPIKLQKDTTGFNIELFKEPAKNFRITDRKIEKDGRLTFIWNRQLEKPSLEILQPSELNSSKYIEFKPTNDTASVWTSSLEFDSISVVVRDKNIGLDTVLIKRNKRDTYNKTLSLEANASGEKLKPGSDLVLTFSAPVKNIDPRKISLLQDSLPVTGLRVLRDSSSTRRIILRFPWKDEKKYILNLAENGFSGVYGGFNKATTVNFSKDIEENYGTLSLMVSVPDTSSNYLIEILNDKDVSLSTTVVKKSTRLNFPTLGVGKYSIRVIYDKNKNKKWDTGSVSERRQPEAVWNHPTQIALRANFEIEEKLVIPKAP